MSDRAIEPWEEQGYLAGRWLDRDRGLYLAAVRLTLGRVRITRCDRWSKLEGY